jgi:hypothetical protein
MDKRNLDRLWNETGLGEFIGFGTPGEVTSRVVDEMLSFCPNCGKALDAFQMCPDTAVVDAQRGITVCRETQPNDHPGCCSCERCMNTRKILEAN